MATTRRFTSRTGLDNNSLSITNLGTIGSSLALSGANSLILTTTGPTDVTLPNSGTLASVGSVTPLGAGIATAGTAATAARSDHVHPVQDASTLSGTTLAPTVISSSLTSVGTLNSLSVAGSAAVNGSASVAGNISITGNITSNGKILTGNQINNPNIANVWVQSNPTGINGNRSINLIDSEAVIKVARIGGSGNPSIELQEWDSTITTNLGYWEMMSINGNYVLRERSTGVEFPAMTIAKSNRNVAFSSDVSASTFTLPSSSTALPTIPAANNYTVFCKTLAGREMLAGQPSTGLDAVLQPAVWRQKIARWNPAGGTSTVPGVDGFGTLSTTGTVTTRTVGTANLFTRQQRLGYVTNNAAGNMCGHWSPIANYSTGNGAGLGGFFYSCRFGFADTANPVGTRGFVGLSSAVGTPPQVEPSTVLNCIGIAQLSTSATQLYIVYGGIAAQTPIPLGTNFPPYTGTGATLGVAYDFTVYSPPSLNGVLYYRVERLGTSFIAEGTITPVTVGSQTPNSTTLLAHRAWRTNNANSGVVGVDVIGVYIETDY